MRKVVVFLGALLALSGCTQEEKEILAWVRKVSGLRVKALEAAQITPYRKEQHLALKAYFGELAGKAISLKSDPKQTEGLSLASARAQVFVTQAQWLEVMGNCQRDEFFLCAEEVRAYPEVLEVFESQR